jgi:putative ABC transport system permease protein
LIQDIRFAWRLLHRDRAYGVTSLLVLGLGIGVHNMLFTILNAHTIRGLPIRDVERVVYVSTFDDRTPDRGLSYADFEDLRSSAQPVVSVAAFTSGPIVLADNDHPPDRIEGASVTGNAFALIGVRPLLGRAIAEEDDRAGAALVAMLGEGTWKLRYAGDPSVLGRTIGVNGASATVVGVLPAHSGFPGTAEVWVPLAQTPGLTTQSRNARTLRVFGRVLEGSTLDEARVQIESIVDRLARDHPDTNKNVRARVVPINERFLGRLSDPAWRAFAAVGFLIVIISCANVANLVLATSLRRAREIAIRSSLGASRGRVLRQLLLEGCVLALIGGVFGLGISIAAVRVFRSAIPENVLPYWLDYSFDSRVFLALFAVSLGTVFVFALLPAVRASKTDVTSVLKDGGSSGRGGRSTQRWATTFLAAEFGLAVVLLAQMTMSLRNHRPELPSDDAIQSQEVLTAVITLPGDTYRSPDTRVGFFRQLTERLSPNPAIKAVSMASALPLQGAPEGRLDVDGRAPSGSEPAPTVRTVTIAPRYFETFGLALVRGRDFTESDGTPGAMHAMVNERLAMQYFGNEDPIGRRISLGASDASGTKGAWLTIVGVAPDIRQRPVPDPDAVVYLPYRTTALSTATLIVRTRNGGGDLATNLRKDVQAIDNNLPLYRTRTMQQVVRDAQWNARLSARLILSLTFIAVVLSTVGLYAVTAYGVRQRTHELGLRIALGAGPKQIVAVIARRVLAQLAIGFGAGLICTMLWDRTFVAVRPGVLAADPVSLLIVAAVLVLAATIACAVPIRRAMRLQPNTAMQQL